MSIYDKESDNITKKNTRYNLDLEYRERIKKYQRERYWIIKAKNQKDSEIKNTIPDKRVKFTPEEAKQRKLKYIKEWTKMKKETDPEFKERQNEYVRKHLRIKKEQSQNAPNLAKNN